MDVHTAGSKSVTLNVGYDLLGCDMSTSDSQHVDRGPHNVGASYLLCRDTIEMIRKFRKAEDIDPCRRQVVRPETIETYRCSVAISCSLMPSHLPSQVVWNKGYRASSVRTAALVYI